MARSKSKTKIDPDLVIIREPIMIKENQSKPTPPKDRIIQEGVLPKPPFPNNSMRADNIGCIIAFIFFLSGLSALALTIKGLLK